MASWGDLLAMAPHMLAGTWAKTAGAMRPRMSVQNQLDLGGGADYGPPVPWLRPVPLLVEGVDQVGRLRGDGRGARDDVPQAGCQAALDGQGEVLVRLGQ